MCRELLALVFYITELIFLHLFNRSILIFVTCRFFSHFAACNPDEYDCEDATCIAAELECNGKVNCRFRWDEDETKCHVSFSFVKMWFNIVYFKILQNAIQCPDLNHFRRVHELHPSVPYHSPLLLPSSQISTTRFTDILLLINCELRKLNRTRIARACKMRWDEFRRSYKDNLWHFWHLKLRVKKRWEWY